MVAKGQNGLSAVVTSGTTRLGTFNLVQGYNKFSFGGMTTGKVTVEVKNGSGRVIGGTGPKEVGPKEKSTLILEALTCCRLSNLRLSAITTIRLLDLHRSQPRWL